MSSQLSRRPSGLPGCSPWRWRRWAGLWAYAASYIASEAIETVALGRLACWRHLRLTLRIDRIATRAAAPGKPAMATWTISATMAYPENLDISLLELPREQPGGGVEYSAASSVASLTLSHHAADRLGTHRPSASARSMASGRAPSSTSKFGGPMELRPLAHAIPASLMIILGAPTLMRAIFGSAFGYAAPCCCILVTMPVLTYVAIILAQTLTMLERAWALTTISLAGLVVNVGLNVLIVPRALAYLGDGGGGAGCAVAMLGTELFVTSCMLTIVGRNTFDRRSAIAVAKALGAYVIVVAVHHALAPLGPARLCIDLVLYMAIALSSGALKLRAIVLTVRRSMHQKEGRADPRAESPQAIRPPPPRSAQS